MNYKNLLPQLEDKIHQLTPFEEKYAIVQPKYEQELNRSDELQKKIRNQEQQLQELEKVKKIVQDQTVMLTVLFGECEGLRQQCTDKDGEIQDLRFNVAQLSDQ
ncbi:unnamed protein product (macronuclear) [Paramecium tetraurelia]|uniref:Uncharacterized protein n=1 Tax=Paramecium tetraurelia TaxID=5888 RepID=A0EGH3_PARTE|nr:uncharacterized protein GSPATT00026738001 [Paramecium tetraurelia]CAK94414.1 unnamed protein product [Paramecium tetraurelia]|eukprot:XP_001461787.1 hypothetical protein (macronuclear) [Paramecium tetraurelia strain d4-2]